jgi:AcrR family transcriptional regulator
MVIPMHTAGGDMARRFSEQEKGLIVQRLLEAGHRRFSAFGLKKTSVAELADDVGIAKGSFYAFFGSKEELFLEVAAVHARTVSQEIAARTLAVSGYGSEGLRALILDGARIVAEGKAHSVFREEDALLARQRVSPDVLAKHAEADEHWLLPVVRDLREHGVARHLEPQTAAELLATVVLAPLGHGAGSGESFVAALGLLADAVVRVLLDGGSGAVTGGCPDE